MRQDIKTTINLYNNLGLERAVKTLERQGFSQQEIIAATSYFLEQNKFAENGPVVIGVASLKGGVGKSTTAENLAYTLATHGMVTGLADIDFGNPNMLRRVYRDTLLDFGDEFNISLNGTSSVNDVVLGEKVLIKQKRVQKKSEDLEVQNEGPRKRKSEYRFDRKHLRNVGVQSSSRSNLTYFLADNFSKITEARQKFTKEEIAELLERGFQRILQQSRELTGYHTVVLDFPVLDNEESPERIDTFIGCDKRIYVVDVMDRASIDGLDDLINRVKKRQIRAEDNLLVLNRIGQYNGEADRRDLFNRINSVVANVYYVLSGGEGDYKKHAKEEFSRVRESIRDMGLENIGLASHPTYLFEMPKIREIADEGRVYLADDANRSTFYGSELTKLVDYIVKSEIKGKQAVQEAGENKQSNGGK